MIILFQHLEKVMKNSKVKAKFIPLEEKINNYVGNVMLDPDADWRQFINPERHLAEKFGVNPATISK